MQVFSHQVTLLQAEEQTLQEANEALSKHWRAKQMHLQDGGSINGSQARDIMAKKGVVEEKGCVEKENEGLSKRHQMGLQLCGIYYNAGHNAKTCSDTGEITSLSDSE